jgi:hypothetical protein
MNAAVQVAIEFMWERYGDSLTLTDLARSAILSKFHFCRVFGDATGISPGRFLAAVRGLGLLHRRAASKPHVHRDWSARWPMVRARGRHSRQYGS